MLGTGGDGAPGSGGSATTGAGGDSGTGGGTGMGGGTGAGGTATGAGGSGTGMGGTGTGMGGTGAGGTVAARTFPTQACLDKASTLLAMMTSDEKMAQLQQIERANATASDITTYGVGSVYSQGGSGPTTNTPTGWADMIDGFRTASFSSRLKIPIIYGLDVVHGVGPVKGATVFPHNIGLGATRDPALVEQVATAVAEEAAGVGADFPFAPVVAVARDERWGRTYESFGETPELPSAMGVAYTNGFQKRGGPFTVLANAKHYLGDGGTMNGVNAGNTSGDETALRALHLTPYQAVVGAGVGSIMASYSSWQGTRMHMNTMMITDVLKGQLGFAGFVGSDYNGCTHERREPGWLPERRRRHGHDVRAQRVVFLVDGAPAGSRHRPAEPHRRRRPTHPGRQVRDGPARRHAAEGRPDIDSAVSARPRTGRWPAQAVAASVVVLKNDGGVLPLSKTVPGVALGGKTADNIGNQCGGWTVTWQGMSGNVTTGGTTVRAALEGVLTSARVNYALDGSATGNGATVGIAVIGETPYSEGCGDIPSPAGRDLVRQPADVAGGGQRRRGGRPEDEERGPEDRGRAGDRPAADPRPDPADRGRDRGRLAAREPRGPA